MKKFKIPCDFAGKKVPFDLYVGNPDDSLHPLHFQQQWLSSQRGGSIPKEVMDSFSKLHKIAIDNKADFEELCMYALGSAADENKKKADKAKTEGADEVKKEKE